MKQELPLCIGFIDDPGPFSSLETWELFLTEVQALPEWTLKVDMIRGIERMISLKRRESQNKGEALVR
ncbi:hypothetical protein [Bradyrhizobium elkanii]|uniref:hypothetical protein n=1 Tax=Bradyrhizobium elkanii TaxID=29448 RepID=UPI000488138A|nr:hypothetical protein [Bradyrhizobium elkanii]